MINRVPKLKSSILMPVILINFVLFIIFSIIIFQLINSSMSTVSQRQFQSTLEIFSSSIRDSFLRGLDNEVDSYCRLLAKGDSVEGVRVTRDDGLIVCSFDMIGKASKGRLFKEEIHFTDERNVAGTVEVVFSSDFYGILLRNIAMTLLVVLSLSLLAFSFFGSWIVQHHLTPFSTLANKLFKGEIHYLKDVELIEGADRNFEIKSLTTGVASLYQNTISYQHELVKNEKLNAINEYSRLIAHDIKSPLSGIQAGVQFLSKKPEQSSKLIADSVQRIEQMIDRILAKNQIDALEANLQAVEVKIYFTELLDRLKSAFSAHAVKIEQAIDIHESGYIDIDPDLIFRAMCNLIKNAIEALSNENKGIVEVDISCTQSTCFLTIKDNGPGIPAEIIPELGRQGATFGKNEGNGLGLYQVRKSIELMSGKFKIESECGKGSRVTIEIPLKKEEK